MEREGLKSFLLNFFLKEDVIKNILKKEKLFKKILISQKNVKFKEFVNLIEAFEFYLVKINGSHHIFKHLKTGSLLNIQNVGGEVKPYQIKQFLYIIEKYNLTLKT